VLIKKLKKSTDDVYICDALDEGLSLEALRGKVPNFVHASMNSNNIHNGATADSDFVNFKKKQILHMLSPGIN
jgi:hypothetical protein